MSTWKQPSDSRICCAGVSEVHSWVAPSKLCLCLIMIFSPLILCQRKERINRKQRCWLNKKFMKLVLLLAVILILGASARPNHQIGSQRPAHSTHSHHWVRHLQQQNSDPIGDLNTFIGQAQSKLLTASLPVAIAVADANSVGAPRTNDLSTNYRIAAATGDIKYT